MDIKILSINDTDEENIKGLLQIIKDNRSSLYYQITTNLKKENSPGIRADVLQFLADHIELLPGDDDFIYHIGQFAGNIKLSPEWLEWMLEYYAGEGKISVSDFSMIVNDASLKEITLEDLKAIFSRNEDDQLRIMKEIEGDVKTDDVDTNKEVDADTTDTDNQNEVEDFQEGTIPPSIQKSTEEVKPAEGGYINLFDDMLTAVSLSRKPDESVNEVRDRLSLLFNNQQNLLSEISSSTTEAFRTWEKDREEIERLRSLYSMLQRVLEQQTQVINELRSDNFRLKNEINNARKTAIQREAINQRIAELGNLVRDTESNIALDMIPDEIS